MRLHANPPVLEPPGGDYIAYLERLVGPPPSQDLEALGQQVVSVLTEQSIQNVQAGKEMRRDEVVDAASGVRGGPGRPDPAREALDGLPDLAGAIGAGTNVIARLITGALRLFAGVLLWLGIALIAASFFFGQQDPGLSPVPGFVLVVIGIVMRAMTPKLAAPAAAAAARRARAAPRQVARPRNT